MSVVNGFIFSLGGNTTVQGTGGSSSGGFNQGVRVTGGAGTSQITVQSTSGTLQVTGLGGAGVGGNNHGIYLDGGADLNATGSGTVTISGTAGNLGSNNSGVYVDGSGTTIQSGSGALQVTGQGGGDAAGSSNTGVTIQNSASVSSSASGDITITGTSGNTDGANNYGVLVSGGATQVSTGNGNIQVTGTGDDNATSYAVAVSGRLQNNSTKTVTVVGDSIDLSAPTFAITTGTAILRPKTNTTPINLGDADVFTGTPSLGLADAELDRIIASTTLQIGDANSALISVKQGITPLGYSVLSLGTNTSFTSTGGFTSTIGSATNYTKVLVSGVLTIDPAATLTISSSFTPTASDVFTIVENTSASTTTGAFAGKTEGSTVFVSTFPKKITYAGGTGTNDVQLFGSAATLSASLTSGNLVITDTDATGKNNSLSVSRTGNSLIITDASELFPNNGGISGASLSNGNKTLTINNFTSTVTGSVTFDTGGGNDNLTVDLSTGDAISPGGITFNGGETSGDDDGLTITGGSQGTVTYSYSNTTVGNGSVDMSAFGTVTYTGLEPITNTGTATDIIFNLPSGPNTAVLGDDGDTGNTLSRLTSPTLEQTDFANPTGSLTINRGSASDTLTVNALPNFNAGLTVGTAASPFSTVTFAGAVTLAAGKTLSAAGTNVNASATGALAVSGTGAINVAADNVALDPAATLSAAGTVSIVPVTATRPINLGTNIGTSLSLTDAELDLVTAGTLQIGNVTSGAITMSAVISPANYQTLSLGQNTSFAASGSFASDIASATVYEKIQLAGTLSIAAGAALAVNALGGFTPSPATSFTLISNDSTDTITGTFSGKPEGALVSVGGIGKQLTYQGTSGTGNDVVLLSIALGDWVFEGPGSVQNGQLQNTSPDRQVAGATNAVLPHPTNANIVYIATVNGGIWKTTNATATNPTWVPQTDSASSLSVSALAFDRTDPSLQTLVAGLAHPSSYGTVGGPLDGILPRPMAAPRGPIPVAWGYLARTSPASPPAAIPSSSRPPISALTTTHSRLAACSAAPTAARIFPLSPMPTSNTGKISPSCWPMPPMQRACDFTWRPPRMASIARTTSASPGPRSAGRRSTPRCTACSPIPATRTSRWRLPPPLAGCTSPPSSMAARWPSFTRTIPPPPARAGRRWMCQSSPPAAASRRPPSQSQGRPTLRRSSSPRSATA